MGLVFGPVCPLYVLVLCPLIIKSTTFLLCPWSSIQPLDWLKNWHAGHFFTFVVNSTGVEKQQNSSLCLKEENWFLQNFPM